jgi:hypothetical protein
VTVLICADGGAVDGVEPASLPGKAALGQLLVSFVGAGVDRRNDDPMSVESSRPQAVGPDVRDGPGAERVAEGEGNLATFGTCGRAVGGPVGDDAGDLDTLGQGAEACSGPFHDESIDDGHGLGETYRAFGHKPVQERPHA